MEHRTVVLAAGDFPRKGGAAWKLLAAAKRVVACDSAADAYRRRFRKWPTVVIGDLDSFSRSNLFPFPFSLIPVPDQDTNDLEKALAYCAKQGWRDPVVVGATGKREDHSLGNVFRALAYNCTIVTDHGRFVPVRDKATLAVTKGSAISVFAPDPKTRMTSKGLEWPLAPVRFRNLYCATLNRATSARVTLTTTKPVSVFVEQQKRRKTR